MEQAIIYIRVSSEQQTEKSQLDPCLKFCEEHQWTVAGVLSDHAKSAYKNVKRPQYDRVLSLVKNKKIKHVVVWSLDRITRRGVDDLRSVISYFEAYDVQLHSVQEHWIEKITQPGLSFLRDFAYDLLAWIAKSESDRKSELVKNSKKYKRALKKGTVGRPSVMDALYVPVLELLKAGKSYRKISAEITYKAKYGKIKHVSVATINEIKNRAIENGDL